MVLVHCQVGDPDRAKDADGASRFLRCSHSVRTFKAVPINAVSRKEDTTRWSTWRFLSATKVPKCITWLSQPKYSPYPQCQRAIYCDTPNAIIIGNIPAPIFLYSSQPVAHKMNKLHYAHAIQLRAMYVVVWIMNVSRIRWLSFIFQKDAIFLVIDHAAPQFNFSHVLPTTYTIQLHHPRIS